MHPRTRSIAWLTSWTALSLACSSPPSEDAAPQRAALSEEAASHAGEPQETLLVLDRREDGARLLGRLEAAVPNGDPDRVLVLRSEPGAPPRLAALEGTRVLDARFVGEHVVVLGADHVLRDYDGAGERVLDRDAEPPLTVAGTVVAYVRGAMPFFEVARADVSTGAARALTDGMAPAWSPALSADGREVVFVSSVTGSPRLHRVDESGAVTPLAPSARTPSSPEAPRLDGDHLHFRDEAGAAVVELSSGRVLEGGQ